MMQLHVHPQPAAPGAPESAAQALKQLRWQMFRTNIFFHSVRNNPRHREQYYFALLSLVGFDRWQHIDPIIRMNWESSRSSFDRMYGMVKDFYRHRERYTEPLGLSRDHKPTIDAAAEVLQRLGTIAANQQELIREYETSLQNCRKSLEALHQKDKEAARLTELQKNMETVRPTVAKIFGLDADHAPEAASKAD